MLKRLLMLLPGLLLSALVQANSSEPGQFAYQAQLTSSNQSLLRLNIPLEVLLEITRQDLGDIRVFDNTGKPNVFLTLVASQTC